MEQHDWLIGGRDSQPPAVPFDDLLTESPLRRTPDEIRASLEMNRAELALSVERFRSELANLTGWPPNIIHIKRTRRPTAFVVACLWAAWVWRRHHEGATER